MVQEIMEAMEAMSTPHKYAKEIIHWANGGEIQWGYKPADGDGECDAWHDYRLGNKVTDFNNPQVIFRIKPKAIRYRVVLMKDSDEGFHYTRTVSCGLEVEDTEVEDEFVRWIDTEWIEVEV